MGIKKDRLIRILLIFSGSLSLGLGVIGIFLPVLPTTPFLLLSAACYGRSSERFYSLLLNSRHLGSFIRNYREKRGIALRTKVLMLAALWAVIPASAFLAVERLPVRILLLAIAAGVTVHLLRIRTLR